MMIILCQPKPKFFLTCIRYYFELKTYSSLDEAHFPIKPLDKEKAKLLEVSCNFYSTIIAPASHYSTKARTDVAAYPIHGRGCPICGFYLGGENLRLDFLPSSRFLAYLPRRLAYTAGTCQGGWPTLPESGTNKHLEEGKRSRKTVDETTSLWTGNPL